MDFFFTDTATPEIYTLSLHDALPISPGRGWSRSPSRSAAGRERPVRRPPRSGRGRRYPPAPPMRDRKSTRLNSSHPSISYAVFCLKKKNRDSDDANELTPTDISAKIQ